MYRKSLFLKFRLVNVFALCYSLLEVGQTINDLRKSQITNYPLFETDPHLKNLQWQFRFRGIVEKMKKLIAYYRADLIASRAFVPMFPL